jgi:hypothetical protein
MSHYDTEENFSRGRTLMNADQSTRMKTKAFFNLRSFHPRSSAFIRG